MVMSNVFSNFVRYVEESMCEHMEISRTLQAGTPSLIYLLGADTVYQSPIRDNPKKDIDELVKVIEATHNESLIAGAFAHEVIIAKADSPAEAKKLVEENIEKLPTAILITFKMNGKIKIFVYKPSVEKNGTVRFYSKEELDIMQDFIHLFEGLFEEKKLH
ncbi:hypothetical protein RsoM2USA_252 [Ralstonia phage RsoM2USA]|nr:hypothetical protein RsoM2USA_252 [Ralstonia phage RsoM2USA]